MKVETCLNDSSSTFKANAITHLYICRWFRFKGYWSNGAKGPLSKAQKQQGQESCIYSYCFGFRHIMMTCRYKPRRRESQGILQDKLVSSCLVIALPLNRVGLENIYTFIVVNG